MQIEIPPESWADEIIRAITALPARNTAAERAVRREYSRQLRGADADFIFQVARALLHTYNQHWHAYELIAAHKPAFQRITAAELEEFGNSINSWWTVDSFARFLAGPAWLKRQVPDSFYLAWAGSENRWRRRAALVSSVALNMRSQGGYGDAARTLLICERLVYDRDDMIVKALSWALRELVVHDPQAVDRFLSRHKQHLAGRVIREVSSKLATGLKTPRRKNSARE